MKKFLTSALAASVLCFSTPEVFAQYQITTLGSAVVESFNGMLVPTANSINNINFNAGLGGTTAAQRNSAWLLTNTNGRGNGTGTGTTGGWWAYADNNGTDKALGVLGNGSLSRLNATATFVNASTSSATSFVLTYTGEQWRGNTGPGSITVQYSINGGTFTELSTSTFNATNNTNGAMNGDASANQITGLGANVTGISLAVGQNIQFRFQYTIGSNSKGVAIDDISVTFNGAAAGNNYWAPGAGGGGDGTWSTANSNWASAAGTQGSGAQASSGALIFGDTAGTVNVSGTVSAPAGLQFTTTGYTIQGGTEVTLAGATIGENTISTSTGVTATIDSVLGGSAGMTKGGAGVLVLGGVNTFSGGVVVSGGELRIAADSALGNADNDLTLNGTLATTANLTLGAGRAVSGSATLDIASGTTLTVAGDINTSATTLSDTGTLDLQGATRSLGNIALNAAGTVNASGAISAAGLTASGLTSGTATVNPDIVFTSGDKTLNVASGGTVDLGGALSNGGGTGRIVKTGAGTLVLSGANTMGGLRIGSTGSSPIDGGTVILENSVIGTQAQAIQHNFGILSAASNLTFTNGLSIGGRTGAVAVLGGSDMDFQGQSSFFRGTGTSGELRLDINNTTTFSGGFGATSGSGSATGVTFGGNGTLIIGGNGSAFTDSLTFGSSLTAVRVTTSNALASATIVGGADKLQIATTNMTVAGITGSQNISLDTVDPTPQAVALTISNAVSTANTGIISGSGSLTKTGAGSLVLGGANTYTGPTSILEGNLTLSLNGSLTSDVTVGSLGSIGGRGSITGDLFLSSGANFVFDINGPLVVNSGTVSFGGLSIADIVGLTSATVEGTYTLIDGTATINVANVIDFGPDNQVSIGGGKFAYFKEGSLQVEVVPEPSTYALLSLAAAGLGAHLIRRRRR